jgi:hypothetical protein
MVPIPRTHDQYGNAQFYVNKYKDILLDSKSDKYTETMLDIFTQNKSFKKEILKKDILAEISMAKDIIVQTIIS